MNPLMNPKIGEILQSVLLCNFKNKFPHYIFFCSTPISLRDRAAMLASDLRGEAIRRERDLRRAVTRFGN